jgi:hypothetical protein
MEEVIEIPSARTISCLTLIFTYVVSSNLHMPVPHNPRLLQYMRQGLGGSQPQQDIWTKKEIYQITKY